MIISEPCREVIGRIRKRKSRQRAAAHLAGAPVVLDLEAVVQGFLAIGRPAGCTGQELELPEGPVLEFLVIQ